MHIHRVPYIECIKLFSELQYAYCYPPLKNKIIIFVIFVCVSFFDLDAPLSSLFSFSSLLSLSYLEICLMVPFPPQFLPPPLLVEISSLVSGWTR